MRFIIVGILLFLSSPFCNAQQSNTDTLKIGDMIFIKVDVEAQFDGGAEAWRKFLLKNFKVEKITNQMPHRDTAYMETAIVKFVVKKDGRLADIQLENEVPLVLKNEVLRLMAKSPVWIPAMRNGEKVNAYRRQPISIIIEPK